MKTSSLMEPRIVPATPNAKVIEKAINLISALGAPNKIKKLLSDLEAAAKANRELIETATALKSEIANIFIRVGHSQPSYWTVNFVSMS